MDITEVRVRLVASDDGRLKAFCSVTIDDQFVIRDIKIIEGPGGHFVAMPCRRISDHCRQCGEKNHLRARYCNNCGKRLSNNRVRADRKGRSRFYADIAHPIKTECRNRIQERVVSEFQEELERSKQPGYQPVDLGDEDY